MAFRSSRQVKNGPRAAPTLGESRQDQVNDSNPSWDRVVEAERSYAEALAQFGPDALSEVVGPALGSLAERRTALKVLRDCEPSLTGEVFGQLSGLLLVSHSLLEECRSLVLRLGEEELASRLGDLVQQVVDDSRSDDEAYRRLAAALAASATLSISTARFVQPGWELLRLYFQVDEIRVAVSSVHERAASHQ